MNEESPPRRDPELRDWSVALEWLQNQLDNVDSYHSQKEIAAWTATAAFIAAVTGLIAAMPQVATDNWQITAGVVLIGMISVLSFLSLQFELRWVSADRDEALMRVMAHIWEHPEDAQRIRLVVDDDAIGFPYVTDVMAVPVTKKERGFLPTLVAIVRVGLFVTWGKFWFGGKKLDGRWKTEAATYLLVILTVFVGVGALWSRVQRPPDTGLKVIERDVETAAGALVDMKQELRDLKSELGRLRQEVVIRSVSSHKAPSPSGRK